MKTRTPAALEQPPSGAATLAYGAALPPELVERFRRFEDVPPPATVYLPVETLLQTSAPAGPLVIAPSQLEPDAPDFFPSPPECAPPSAPPPPPPRTRTTLSPVRIACVALVPLVAFAFVLPRWLEQRAQAAPPAKPSSATPLRARSPNGAQASPRVAVEPNVQGLPAAAQTTPALPHDLERAAVDSVATGNLASARRYYAQLLRLAPENIAFREALRILEESHAAPPP